MKEMVVCCRQEMESTCSREREQHVESLVERKQSRIRELEEITGVGNEERGWVRSHSPL